MTDTTGSTQRPLPWPSDKVTRVPFNVFTDPRQYELEIERIFKGPVWNYLCLEAELANRGDFVTTRIAETPIVVTRDTDGSLHAFVNRCAHRGSLLCLESRGHLEHITCVYHSWSYNLRGELTGVAFERGVKGSGGMPKDFRKQDHNLRRLQITTFAGLVFGSFAPDVPPIEDYLGPDVAARIKRVLHKPIRVIGRNTQVLHNNWKLYFENTKDSYHASLLHLFFTTFRINRLNQKGGIIVDQSGGHHVSYSMIDAKSGNSDYSAQRLRSDSDVALADPSLLRGVDEFGDGITLQILTVFPGFVLQQIQNALALRQIVPTGVGTTDLVWTYIGFEDDDEAMIEQRLKQSNLAGPAGYVSMEDGAVGNFVQRAVRGADDAETGLILMGGERAESQTSRATETSVRGFWKKYRTLMEGAVPDA